MKFLLQNYNEFKGPIRWHDYINVMINEFPILLLRRYDFDAKGDWKSRYMFQILGIRVK